MALPEMTLETDLGETAEATIRVPANLMGFIRRSYDSREKVLDWMLAIVAVSAAAFVFRAEIRSMLWADAGPDAGRADAPVPNQDTPSAFPYGAWGTDRLYTYNLPSSRSIRYGIGPSSTRVPQNPARAPEFPVESC